MDKTQSSVPDETDNESDQDDDAPNLSQVVPNQEEDVDMSIEEEDDEEDNAFVSEAHSQQQSEASGKEEQILLSIEDLLNRQDCPVIFERIVTLVDDVDAIRNFAANYMRDESGSLVLTVAYQRELIKTLLYAMGCTEMSKAQLGWTLAAISEAFHKLDDAKTKGESMPIQTEVASETGSLSKHYEMQFCNVIYTIINALLDSALEDTQVDFFLDLCKLLIKSFASHARYIGILVVRASLRSLLRTMRKHTDEYVRLSQSDKGSQEEIDSEYQIHSFLFKKIKPLVEMLCRGCRDIDVENRISGCEELTRLMVKYPLTMICRMTMDSLSLNLTSMIDREQNVAVRGFAEIAVEVENNTELLESYMKEHGKIFIVNLRKAGDLFENSLQLLLNSKSRGWLNEDTVEFLDVVMTENLFHFKVQIAKHAGNYFVDRCDGKNVLCCLAKLLWEQKEDLMSEAFITRAISSVIEGVEPEMVKEAFKLLRRGKDIGEEESIYLLEVLRHTWTAVQNKHPSKEAFREKLLSSMGALIERFEENDMGLTSLLKMSKLLTSEDADSIKEELDGLLAKCSMDQVAYLKLILKVVSKSIIAGKSQQGAIQNSLNEASRQIVQLANGLPRLLLKKSMKKSLQTINLAALCLDEVKESAGDLTLKCGGLTLAIFEHLQEADLSKINEELIVQAVNLEYLAYYRFAASVKSEREFKKSNHCMPTFDAAREAFDNFNETFVRGAQGLLGMEQLNNSVKILVLKNLFSVLLRQAHQFEKLGADDDLLLQSLRDLIFMPSDDTRKEISSDDREIVFNVICHLNCIDMSKKIGAELLVAIGRQAEQHYQQKLIKTFLPLFAVAVENSSEPGIDKKEKYKRLQCPFGLMVLLSMAAIENAEGDERCLLVRQLQRSICFLMENLTPKSKDVRIAIMCQHKNLWSLASKGGKHELLLTSYGAPLVTAFSENDRSNVLKVLKESKISITGKDFENYIAALEKGFKVPLLDIDEDSPDSEMAEEEYQPDAEGEHQPDTEGEHQPDAEGEQPDAEEEHQPDAEEQMEQLEQGDQLQEQPLHVRLVSSTPLQTNSVVTLGASNISSINSSSFSYPPLIDEGEEEVE